MLRSLTTTAESWRPPARSHGLPGARCINTKVMTITKKTMGNIHSTRLTTKKLSAKARLLVRARIGLTGGAPMIGRPAAVANSLLLVLLDVEGLVVLVAGQPLVVKRSDLHVA